MWVLPSHYFHSYVLCTQKLCAKTVLNRVRRHPQNCVSRFFNSETTLWGCRMTVITKSQDSALVTWLCLRNFRIQRRSYACNYDNLRVQRLSRDNNYNCLMIQRLSRGCHNDKLRVQRKSRDCPNDNMRVQRKSRDYHNDSLRVQRKSRDCNNDNLRVQRKSRDCNSFLWNVWRFSPWLDTLNHD